MRPDEHWKAGTDLIGQIEQAMAANPRVTIGEDLRDLYRLAKLHLAAAHTGALVASLRPAQIIEYDPRYQGEPVDREAVLAGLRERFGPRGAADMSARVDAAVERNTTCQMQDGACVTPWHRHADDEPEEGDQRAGAS